MMTLSLADTVYIHPTMLQRDKTEREREREESKREREERERKKEGERKREGVFVGSLLSGLDANVA